MFLAYYGFTRAPFSKTIETDKLFATVGQKELTARLTYLVRERGCGLVTGEIGSGKSTAVRAFTAGLDANSYLCDLSRQSHHRQRGPLPRTLAHLGPRTALH